MKRAGTKALGLWIVLLLLGLIAPWATNDYTLGVVLSICMWIALTQSWIVLSGLTGYISLGHVVFYGIGAYILALLWGAAPLWAIIPLAGLATGAFALLIGFPVLRVRGPYFVILTFGRAELVKFIVINIESGLGQSGRLLFGAPSLEDLYYIMLALALVATALVWITRRSRFGAGLRSIREDEEAAETVGIPVARFKVFAFALSAIIPGMVGATIVMRTNYFQPMDAFSPVVSFTIVTMAIIGGGDDAPGPILGVLFLVLLREVLWSSFPEVYMIIVGALLVAFVLFAPDGVHGRIVAWRRRRTA